MDDRNLNDSTDGRLERAKDKALGKHDNNPSVLDEVGEGVGGIGGMLAGAAIGTAGGPIGTLIGRCDGRMVGGSRGDGGRHGDHGRGRHLLSLTLRVVAEPVRRPRL